MYSDGWYGEGGKTPSSHSKISNLNTIIIVNCELHFLMQRELHFNPIFSVVALIIANYGPPLRRNKIFTPMTKDKFKMTFTQLTQTLFEKGTKCQI